MNSLSLNLVKLALPILLIFLTSCKACDRFKPFDPTAPTKEKWEMVASWVPSTSPYIVLIDVNKFSKTGLYKDLLAKDPSSMHPMLGKLDMEADAGIAVFTKGLMLIGGKFNESAVTEKIKRSLADDSVTLATESYHGKTILTDPSSDTSMSFLENYLIAFGKNADLKKLVDARGKDKAGPPEVDTSYMLWGRIDELAKQFRPEFSSFDFNADIAANMKLKANIRFAGEKEARGFAEEMQGIKTIKTIQSIDEPWLADVLDGIDIKTSGNSVILTALFDASTIKTMLKKVVK